MKKTLLTVSLVAAGLLVLYFGAPLVDLKGFIMKLHGR